jgi:hypothetical protein
MLPNNRLLLMIKTASFFIAIALLSLSAKKPGKPFKINRFEMAQGDSLSFSHGPQNGKTFVEGIYKKGAYDGKRYTVQVSGAGNITVSDLQESRGESANELDLFLGAGYILRKGDTTSIFANSSYTTFYLIPIHSGIVDSFSNKINVKIVSKDYQNAYCPNRIETFSHLSVLALPKGVKYKAIYKAVHLNKEIGKFAYFSVTDSNGKSKQYPMGDYIIVGGNTKT